MLALAVALAVLREIGRALAFPLQMLAFLPRRGVWRRRTARAIATAEPDPEASLRAFLAQARGARRAGRPHVFLSAGESSGELHAAALLQALRALGLEPRCTAFGGARLRALGADVVYPLSEHAVMGFFAVLRHLPRLVGVYARFLRLLRDDRPDAVVLVDYPGLHLVLGRAARARGVPVVHYVAPQYWAWAPWRVHRYRRSVDVALTILPFEPAFFEQLRIRAVYVGHPLLDQPHAAAGAQADMLVLLPGSRTHDIRAHLPGMLTVARELARRRPGLRVRVAHTDERKAGLIRELLAAHRAGGGAELALGPLAAALAGARAVLAKSGTGSLESCLHDVPTVVVYRLHDAAMRWLRGPYMLAPFFASANLVCGREVVPERLLVRDAEWAAVAPLVEALLADGPRRDQCRRDLAELRARLGGPGASARAARVVAAVAGEAAP
jgi:lipid-A-disaccharide synthase